MAGKGVTRRELVNLSLVMGGGLVLGRLCSLEAAEGEAFLQPNPFVRIGQDGTVSG